MSTVTIYNLRDPESLEIRYVGRTNGDLLDRLAEHIGEASGRSTSGTRFTLEKKEWIRDLLSRGRSPLIEPITQVSPEAASDEEFRMIAIARMEGHNVVNVSAKITMRILDDMDEMTNNAISVKHDIDRKTVALARRLFKGSRIGGKPVKPPGRPRSIAA